MLLCSPGTVTARPVGGPLDGRCRWLDGTPHEVRELAVGGPVIYHLDPATAQEERPVYIYQGRWLMPGMGN